MTLEEYLTAPSAENLLALGANRAQILAESLAMSSPSESQDSDTTSLFKVAGLYTKVTACHVSGCGAQMENAVAQTVGKFTRSH